MATGSPRYLTCPLCEAMCGLEARVEGGRVLSIRGDDEDPLSRGYLCPKGVALQDLHEDPDRLRGPRRRRPGTSHWEEVSWDEALDGAADAIRRVRSAHGPDALAVYLGNPNVHNADALLYGPPLLRELRTRHRFSATSVDQLPHHVAASEMFGHRLLLPVPDVDRTDFLLILGANPAVSNGSMMTAPGMKRRLHALRERGGKVVVVDPRRTETARLADRHHFVRPGTDALLLLALLHTLFTEGLARPGRLEGMVRSLPALREAANGFAPERVAEATRVAAEAIRRLARELAAAPSAAVYGRFGLSTQAFGALCQWLIQALHVVTGNLDRPGGAMFPRPAIDLLDRTGPGRRGRWRSRVRGAPEIDGELPAAVLAEEIETPGPGRVRALLVVAGNPVLSVPNGARLERALSGLEALVAVDPYLNETTRHAHWILPPVSPLERDHYDLVFHALAVRNTARFSPALLPRTPGGRDDGEILAGLHRRLGSRRPGARVRRWLAATLGVRRLLDLGLRTGPYGSGWRPFGAGLTLSRLLRAPHGIDLGPLEPCLPERLRTRDGKIEVAPAFFLADLPRLEARLGAHDPPGDELVLLGRRQLQSNNSWMHNAPRLMRGAERCTLLLHPEDAARFRVEDGRRVVVVSRTGRAEAVVEVSDEMMPGVASLPHGWGHHREGTSLAVASAHPGASLNDVTDDGLADVLVGTADLSGVRIRVEPLP